jgi:hypothetical protein
MVRMPINRVVPRALFGGARPLADEAVAAAPSRIAMAVSSIGRCALAASAGRQWSEMRVDDRDRRSGIEIGGAPPPVAPDNRSDDRSDERMVPASTRPPITAEAVEPLFDPSARRRPARRWTRLRRSARSRRSGRPRPADLDEPSASGIAAGRADRAEANGIDITMQTWALGTRDVDVVARRRSTRLPEFSSWRGTRAAGRSAPAGCASSARTPPRSA